MFSETDINELYDRDCYDRDFHRKVLQSDQEETEPLNITGQYKLVSEYDFAVGCDELHLGNYQKARSAFAEATAFLTAHQYIVRARHRQGKRSGGAWHAYLGKTEKALRIAVLGSDPSLTTLTINQAQKYREEDARSESDSYWRHRVLTLASLLDDDTIDGQSHLEQSNAFRESVERQDSESVAELYRGLLEGDETVVESACDEIAAIHERNYEPPPADGGQLVSLHAVAGLALARRQGLEVCVDRDSVPDAVCNHDWEYREHELSDIARKTIQAIEDHDIDE